MTDRANAQARGGGAPWIVLALVVIAAIIGLAFLAKNNDREEAAASGAVPTASTAVEDEDAERVTQEAAADTERTLDGAARAAGDVAEEAAEVTVNGARDAAEAAERAIERSTDGDPDSDNNERR